MIPIKKSACAALAGAILLSMTGCSAISSEEDVYDAGDSFAKAVADCDLDKMAKVSSEDFEDDTKEWEEILVFDEGDKYDANAARFADAVADTISYEIDDESAKIDKDEATVDVEFTMVDYESVLRGSYYDIDAMIDAIEDADEVEIKVTLELSEVDGEWVVTNYGEVMDDLYGFTDTRDLMFEDEYYENYDPYSDPEYDFELDLESELTGPSYGYISDTQEMYDAFIEDQAYFEGAGSEAVFASGTSSIIFVQPSSADLGTACFTVEYSAVGQCDYMDTELIFVGDIDPVIDENGNVSYQLEIEEPEDGYYLIEVSPSVGYSLDPVVTAVCRVGDAA